MKIYHAMMMVAGLLAALPAASAQEQVIGADPAPEAAAANAWASSCGSATRTGEVVCQLSQRAISGQTRSLLAAVTLRFPAGGEAGLVITTPTGVALPAGVTLDIDGASGQTLPYEACDRSGCYATIPVSPELIAAMQAGQKLNISIQDRQKRSGTVALSLAGFTAAYDSVK